MLDENYNNLAEAVISVSGINHDVTSGRWPLLGGVRGKPSCPHLFSAYQEASLYTSETSRGVKDTGGRDRKGGKNRDRGAPGWLSQLSIDS